MRLKPFLVILAVCALAIPVFAQDIPVGEPGYKLHAATTNVAAGASRPDPSPDFGTASWHELNIGTTGFTPLASGQWSHFLSSSGWAFRSGGTNTATCSNIVIPTGANWNYITTWTNDTDASNDITYEVYSTDLVTNTATTVFSWTSTGTPGIERVARALGPITVDNDRHTYQVCVFSPATTSNLEYAGATMWYHLQVSPGPATATFADVPTSSGQFKFVEALYASGITGGCGGGNYCPNSYVTRGQMAVFLASALGLHWEP